MLVKSKREHLYKCRINSKEHLPYMSMAFLYNSSRKSNVSYVVKDHIASDAPTGDNRSEIYFDGILEDFDLWNAYLKPSEREYILMSLYILVFVISTTGNLLSKYTI